MKQIKNKFKVSIILFLFMAFSSALSAQTGLIVLPILAEPPPDIMVYIGAGSNSPSTKLKDDAYATNTVGFDANVFVSVIKKKNFSFGFNGGGEYFSSNKDNAPAAPNAFHVIGETSSTVAVTSSGSSKNSGFKLGVAPQVNFFIGKRIIVSQMIEAGYMSMTNKGFSTVQTTNLDGTLYNYTLLSKTETKTNGLAITPKVRLNYMFTKKIGMWVEGNYTVGPTVKSSITTLVPEPEPDENGQYNIDQMMNGTTKTEMRETKFGSFGVHVGVMFSIYDQPRPPLEMPDLIKKDKPMDVPPNKKIGSGYEQPVPDKPKKK